MDVTPVTIALIPYELMPGMARVFTRPFPDDLPAGMNRDLFGAVVYFRDANRCIGAPTPTANWRRFRLSKSPLITREDGSKFCQTRRLRLNHEPSSAWPRTRCWAAPCAVISL